MCVLLLLVALPQSVPSQAPALAPTATTLARGVTYSHLKEASPAGEPWSIHVLRIDRREKSIAIRAVNGSGPLGEMQRELPTALAQRAVADGVTVYAVVNGDYDLPGEHLGISDGYSISSARLWTTGKPIWPTFATLRSGKPAIGGASAGIVLRNSKHGYSIGAVNKPESTAYGPESQARLYTREYRPMLKGKAPMTAVVVEQLSEPLPLPAFGTVRGVVREVIEGASEVAVPPDGFVVTQPAGAPKFAFRPGDKVLLSIRTTMNGQRVRDAIGGFPIIVHDRRAGIVGVPNENLPRRHPRTALCYNEREIIFTVVDGRQPQLSVGMTLVELADLMVRLGCREAMNTDGGGSSVMAIATPPQASTNGTSDTATAATWKLRIVNSPSDGRERGRGNALIIVRK